MKLPIQSIRKRIVRKIVWLVVGHLVALLTLSGVVGFTRTKARVLESLKVQSTSELALVELRMSFLVERTENFAKSSAVTNSLIDESGRRDYLPSAVKELGLASEVVSVAVVNYSGEAIATSVSHLEVPSELDLRGTLSRGQLVVIASPVSKTIYVISPVEYYGTPQGAVVVELDLSPSLARIADAPAVDSVTFSLGENEFFHHTKTDDGLLTVDQFADPSLHYLHTLGAHISLGRHKGTAMDPVMASLKESVLIGLVAIAISILLAWRMGSQLAAPIRLLAEKVRDEAERCAPTNTNDELETLAEAFDQQKEQILRARAELEHRVDERTKSLEESTEKLKRSNDELDDFAHIASHDLKEPLRGIHNYSAFLLEDYGDKLDVDGKAKLETLTKLTQRMEQLINDLLYYSQVGRTELAMGHVNMNGVLEQVCESLSISLMDANIDVRIPRPLPTAYCDRIRIAEVLRNLITNAIKYNNKDERWLEIGWEGQANLNEDSKAKHIAFYVKDNGIGIRPKHLDAVFKMFRRLHGREKYGGGHGVGLSIIKKVVERHNGRVWVESTYGEGTTFWFTINDETIV